MNLRQKAKYYKKRCEMLEKLTLPRRNSLDCTETKQPIVTLHSEQYLSLEQYVTMMQATGSMGLTMIEKNMERDFMKQLLNYAQVMVQKDIQSDYIVIKAIVKVVDIKKNSNGYDYEI